MDKDLKKLREVFLSDELDEETRLDNESKLKEWETAIRDNQNFAAWENHDITRLIIQQAKASYKDNALSLAFNRSLTESQRIGIFAKQDALLWLLSLVEKNAETKLAQLHSEIKTALNVT